ncbi:MAG: DUF87 domain-containing protein [Roseiflexaceae bacterium]|nr:DUF87 domain-containing protein [Roseiflexaceae bacterium]
MHVFQLTSFPCDQVGDYENLAWSFGGWFSERPYPVRLLAFNRSCDMRVPRAAVDQQARSIGLLMDATTDLRRQIDRLLHQAGQPALALHQLPPERMADLCDLCAAAPAIVSALEQIRTTEDSGDPAIWQFVYDALAVYGWPLPWMREATRFYAALQERHLRSATYQLLTWEPSSIGPDALALTIRRAFKREPIVGARIPPVLPGAYQEFDTYLHPDQAGDPFLSGLLAYDARGEIDLTILHALMDLPYDLAIAVDIHTQPAAQVLARTERSFAVSRAAASDANVKDARAERQSHDAEAALHELVRQNLHDVQIAVLVSGATRQELEAHVAEVRELLGSRLRLVRPLGVQREILSLWSTRPANQIDLPWKRRNTYSLGVGCYAGIVTYHRRDVGAGLLWGIDGRRLAPLMLDLFADRQAAHMVVLGKTGYGKSYFLNLMALRAAALAGYRVIMLDAFDNAARMQRAAGAGATGNWLTLDTPINILDIVFGDEIGDWRSAQVEHVISQLAMLLGTLGIGANNAKVFVPRIFQPEERGVLDAALSTIYRDCDPDMALSAMPLLEDLIDVLDGGGQGEGIAIANTLSKLLFGTADRNATTLTRIGQRFNAPTGVDWRFERAITCIDLGQITIAAPEWLPFYYAQVIGAVSRYMRDPSRDRSIPTMLIIDEFGYAAQVESVARLAADICKVARKYGIGLMVVDQNPHTFQTPIGREIFENAVAKVLFHLDDSAAATVGELIGDLTPGHVEFLTQAERGETVAVFGNDLHIMLVESSPMEQRQFSGS